MPFKKGETGNPKGRPRKPQALTQILVRAGSRTIEIDGQRVSGKQLVARLAWQALTTGEVKLTGGKTLEMSVREWTDILKWIYERIDGPPTNVIEVSGPQGEPIQHERIGSDLNAIAAVLAVLAEVGVLPPGTGQAGDTADDEIHSS